jgi:hypothetical protein
MNLNLVWSFYLKNPKKTAHLNIEFMMNAMYYCLKYPVCCAGVPAGWTAASDWLLPRQEGQYCPIPGRFTF